MINTTEWDDSDTQNLKRYDSAKYEVLSDKELLEYIDILVDGQYEDEHRDLNLAFRGSSNQRVIDVKRSLAENKVVTKY